MMIRTFSALSLLALLAACGGGGGGSMVEDPTQPNEVIGDSEPETNTGEPIINDGNEAPAGRGGDDPNDNLEDLTGTEDAGEVDPNDGAELEETLAESSETTIALTGIAFVRPGAGGANLIEIREGAFAESSGTRTLDGQLIVLNGDIPGTFTQASSYMQDVNDEVGIIGIATDPSAMPSTGEASFTGGATGLVLIPDNGFDLRDGESTVTVDFASGTVDAVLGNFTSVNVISNNLTPAPFESILLTDAIIDGTSFIGGVVSTAGGDTLAEVVGDNATALSRGQFYGTNEAGTSPTELGGVVFSEGDSGLVYGSFIAAAE